MNPNSLLIGLVVVLLGFSQSVSVFAKSSDPILTLLSENREPIRVAGDQVLVEKTGHQLTGAMFNDALWLTEFLAGVYLSADEAKEFREKLISDFAYDPAGQVKTLKSIAPSIDQVKYVEKVKRVYQASGAQAAMNSSRS